MCWRWSSKPESALTKPNHFRTTTTTTIITTTTNTTQQAARGVDSVRSALGVTQEEASPDALATIYIHGDRDGYCGLCGVDSVAGPGAASCEIADSCQELNTPLGGVAGGQSAAAVIEYVLPAADVDVWICT